MLVVWEFELPVRGKLETILIVSAATFAAARPTTIISKEIRCIQNTPLQGYD